jgi:hypothetical protein
MQYLLEEVGSEQRFINNASPLREDGDSREVPGTSRANEQMDS